VAGEAETKIVIDGHRDSNVQRTKPGSPPTAIEGVDFPIVARARADVADDAAAGAPLRSQWEPHARAALWRVWRQSAVLVQP